MTTSNRPKVLTKQIDQQLCTAIFYPEPGCIASFPDELQYEKHVLEGQHIITLECSSMDTAKKIFADQMTKETFLRIGQSIKIADENMNNISKKYTLMKLLAKERWSKPTRKIF